MGYRLLVSEKILLTGATGFIGKSLLSNLLTNNYSIVAPARKPLPLLHENLIMPVFSDLCEVPDDCQWFNNCDTVVHLAGKAHLWNEHTSEYTRVNTFAALNLARIASLSGVKRLIFVSTIGVNGIQNTRPYIVGDVPAPVTEDAISKLNAEIGLKQIGLDIGMEIVVIRSPLVYGPNAPGNFGKLIALAKKNWPLPLGAIHNKRSLVSLDNLIDLIVTCVEHPKAADQTFLVSDDHDLSTTELLELLISAAGKKPLLLPVPLSWLKMMGKIAGKQSIIERLCGNLQVDITHTKQTLGWTPPISVEEGIRRCFSGQ